MSSLAIYLFGETRLQHASNSVNPAVTKGLQEFFAFLLLRRDRSHKREVLAELLWGGHDPNRSRSCLNTALWRLRRLLEPPGVARGTYLRITGADEIGFNTDSDFWLDVAAFEERVNVLLDRQVGELTEIEVADLDEAVSLCKGDIMDGVYSDWALYERERLRRLHLNALYTLLSCCRHCGKYDKGLRYGYRILAGDPLREEVHRAVMELHLAMGNRVEAKRQFETCRKLLAEELGVPPMDETQSLYQTIMDGQSGTTPRPAPTDATPCRPRLHGSLRQQLSLAQKSSTSAGNHHRQAERLVAELEALERKSGIQSDQGT